MAEANYEFEHNPNTDGGSPQNLRRQEWWSALSGVTGQLYGSFYSWQFPPGWQTNLDTPGIRQFSLMARQMNSRRWYDLVPDLPASVFIGGRGTWSGTGSIETNNFVAAARTLDGVLAMAYVPTRRPLTADLTKFVGPVSAYWFDPTNGRATAIRGSPFPNTRARTFTAPGTNSTGDGDWVLILRAQ